MSGTEISGLKRKIEELEAEIKQLKEDKDELRKENKRLKQDNLCYEAQKAMDELQEALKPHIFRMDDLVRNHGLKHIALEIFKNLDPQDLGICRLVSKEWRNCIDSDRYRYELKLDECRSIIVELNRFHKIQCNGSDRIRDIFENFPNADILPGYRFYVDQLVADKDRCEFIENFVTESFDFIYKKESVNNLKMFVPFMKKYCEKLNDLNRDSFTKYTMKENPENRPPWVTPLHFALEEKHLDVYEMCARSPFRKSMQHAGTWIDLEQRYRIILSEAR